MRPNLKKVISVFSPDAEGNSDWVTIEDVIKGGLKFTKNGNIRRGVAFGVNEFHWEFERSKGMGHCCNADLLVTTPTWHLNRTSVLTLLGS